MIDKIKDSRLLEHKINCLEKQLLYTQHELDNIQRSCFHIGVYFGNKDNTNLPWNELYSEFLKGNIPDITESRCLLCGKKLDIYEMNELMQKNAVICAQNIFQDMEINDRLDRIQSMFLLTTNNYLEMDQAKILEMFNDLLPNSKKEENKQLSKNLQQK